jgi:hypothetical protein
MTTIPSNLPTRRPVHTRRIECVGFERSDGLFDIEGRMVDTKADDANLIFKVVPAAHTDAAPSRYCAEINAAYDCLKGLTIGAGFMKEVKSRLTGTRGCTHLSELLGPIATTAIQTLMGLRGTGRLKREPPDEPDRAGTTVALPMTDTCYAWRADGEVVRFVLQRKREASSTGAQAVAERTA